MRWRRVRGVESAHTQAAVSTVSFVVAAALVVGAVTLFVLGGPQQARPPISRLLKWRSGAGMLLAGGSDLFATAAREELSASGTLSQS
ncbi:MAG: hypothetical protein KIT84_17615 [Labilithrix sp.]|nr:hypothetical protein [Labilithrix sp.]MCW5812851.1 hypothetical protein [Labilithrix sp.]